jgi:hypothetical protein
MNSRKDLVECEDPLHKLRKKEKEITGIMPA